MRNPDYDDLTIKFIHDMNIDVNKVIERLWDQKVEGTLLLSALDHTNLKLLKVLINEFGADVNKKCQVNGKESTLLIFAMERAVR